MLSPEHLRVRRVSDRLVLLELSARQRARAVELGEQLLGTVQASVGQMREELERAFELIETRASERRLVEGLKKLIEDASEFDQAEGFDPAALRSEVFLRAAVARQAETFGAPNLREAVLSAAAEALGLEPAEVEHRLYADLRGAHRLKSPPPFSAEALVAAYQRAQLQAILLRATSVVAEVHCANQDAYRQLFQKLKFRKLLYKLERLDDGGYRISIDGPFSLFDAVVKYGLELALVLPALEACDVLELKARVLWGKKRAALNVEHRHVRKRGAVEPESVLRDDVATLLAEFNALGSAWRAKPAQEILELEGFGGCVPDLVFERADSPRVFLELLGYWSREAVWRRVELAERGLGERIVFAASSRLRVSEEVLENEHAALYVFKGRPGARAIERKLDTLAARR